MAAHQAPPSLGFSRQEHWRRLPFPSPVHESEKWNWSRSVVSDSSQPHGLQPTRLLCPWDFPGKSTGVGCHCLLLVNLLQLFAPYWSAHTCIRWPERSTTRTQAHSMFISFLCPVRLGSVFPASLRSTIREESIIQSGEMKFNLPNCSKGPKSLLPPSLDKSTAVAHESWAIYGKHRVLAWQVPQFAPGPQSLNLQGCFKF